MATPVEAVIEAAEVLHGYELTSARDLAETIEAYSRLAASLERSLASLSHRMEENSSIDAQSWQDVDDMAKLARNLYETGQTAHHNFYDRHEFWLSAGRESE
jgi:hypothetical protein